MSKIEFVSHDTFPEDEYTKEIVYICLDGKYRVCYVRKMTKTGGMFWSVPTVGVTKNGNKEFYPAFLQDSNFLEKDIKDFLDRRSWMNQAPSVQYRQESFIDPLPKSLDEVATNGSLPF